MDHFKKIIVIGASAGGYHTMANLVSAIPADTDIAVFAVLHMSKSSSGDVLCHHLQQRTSLICRVAADGEPIMGAHLYLARPDHHLIIKQGYIRIHNGPRENRWRPSIDVLFRSAAASYDSHVIGIILSGLMDDGTSGMSAIKRSGGLCIVQEPMEAQYPDMPNSVINQIEVDYRVPVADIGYIIQDNLSKPGNTAMSIPEDVKIEADITEKMISGLPVLNEIGLQTHLSCPDCGGRLWKIDKDGILRYRCFTGHAYSERALDEEQREGLEESLWVSIRMLEERRNLFGIMAGHEKTLENMAGSGELEKRKEEVEIHIQRLKDVLHGLDKPNNATL